MSCDLPVEPAEMKIVGGGHRAAMEPNFVHLRVRSDFSIVDGLGRMDLLAERARDLRMPALAVTDFTNLFGLVKFYRASCRFGIKPVIGADFLLRGQMIGGGVPAEITLLAIDNAGYRNLILLISLAYKHGWDAGRRQPTISYDWLALHRGGLVLISRAVRGDVARHLLADDVSGLEWCLDFYDRYFRGDHYLEVIRTGRMNEESYIQAVVRLAICRELPLLATNDVRFVHPQDFETHEIKVAIHQGCRMDDERNLPDQYSPQQYMRSGTEMGELFSDLPEALVNSVELAKRCSVILRLGERYSLPRFPTGKISPEQHLTTCAREALNDRSSNHLLSWRKRGGEVRSIYSSRLEDELQVICSMGLAGYFLIVAEFVQWAKRAEIPVGPGRGSGAGSLVAYVLGITSVDPIRFNLLFERFLNPERISMPDLDVDFCVVGRDTVIEHVVETYGEEAVSQIITFGTLSARAVIRDVGRVMGYPYGFVDKIARLIPNSLGITLAEALRAESALSTLYNTDGEVKLILDMSRRLEGTVRNVGKHAGGVVIAPTKITDFTPLYRDEGGGSTVTQFDKDDIEDIGLVKFDFLGLRTLTIIDQAVKMINSSRSRSGKRAIDLGRIPLNDEKVFSFLRRAETTAVFQLESAGIRNLIRRLRPDTFEDVVSLVALYRPGPLQSGMVDNFINRKHNLEKISYPDSRWQHHLLEPILRSTYGVIVYQEQVMRIAQVLAGYTPGGADILCRAMSKKKPEEMAKQRLVFRSGAERLGIDGNLAAKIFDILEKFAGYGFNRSHSVAYALLSYQTLWLKFYHPAEFMAAVMTSEMENIDKITSLLEECAHMHLRVLPPDVNKSQCYFDVSPGGEIVYGMGAIRGIGKETARSVVKSREEGGNFRDLFDLCLRVGTRKLNHRILGRLIESGACDQLGAGRAPLLKSAELVLRSVGQQTRADTVGQSDMFGHHQSTR